MHLITFSEIATRYLKEHGYTAYECTSEDEARNRVDELLSQNKWPCYFLSDTTGEKDFEEFYTDLEDLDMERFDSIGVIKNKIEYEEKKLDAFMDGISLLQDKKNWSKKDILNLFFNILPEFAHKETGKYLDQRM